MTPRRLAFALFPVLVGPALAQGAVRPWEMLADPAAAGWSAEELAEARERAESAGSAAVMAVHDGVVAVAWGDLERRFECHSVRKSLLSALYGIAVDRGLVDLDTDLAALGIDDLSPLSDVEKSAHLRDLLAARSGIYHPAAKEPADMARDRPERGSRSPGEAFHYNNWDFNVAGIAFGKATGTDVLEAFAEWLAAPLGMRDYRPRDGLYELEPGRSRHPAFAFRLSTRDLARVGLLFTDGGTFAGQRILSAHWIADSTATVSEFEDGSGYGFMWWVYPAGSLPESLALSGHDAFAARGTGGQFVLVVPGERFVFVHRGDTDNDRPVGGGEVWSLADAIFRARPAGGAASDVGELVPLRAEPLPGALPAPVERDARSPIPAERIDALVGAFEAPGLGRCTFFEHDGRLFARAGFGGEAEVFWEGDERFFLRKLDLQFRFPASESGTVEVVEITFRGRRLRGRRID